MKVKTVIFFMMVGSLTFLSASDSQGSLSTSQEEIYWSKIWKTDQEEIYWSKIRKTDFIDFGNLELPEELPEVDFSELILYIGPGMSTQDYLASRDAGDKCISGGSVSEGRSNDALVYRGKEESLSSCSKERQPYSITDKREPRKKRQKPYSIKRVEQSHSQEKVDDVAVESLQKHGDGKGENERGVDQICRQKQFLLENVEDKGPLGLLLLKKTEQAPQSDGQQSNSIRNNCCPVCGEFFYNNGFSNHLRMHRLRKLQAANSKENCSI